MHLFKPILRAYIVSLQMIKLLANEKLTTTIALYMIGHGLSPVYKCNSCYRFGWHDFLSLFSVVGVLTNQKTEFTYTDGTVSSLQLEVIRTQCSVYNWREKVLEIRYI